MGAAAVDASTAYVLICNPDTIVEPGAIKAMVGALEATGAIGDFAKVVDGAKEGLGVALEFYVRADHHVLQQRHRREQCQVLECPSDPPQRAQGRATVINSVTFESDCACIGR